MRAAGVLAARGEELHEGLQSVGRMPGDHRQGGDDAAGEALALRVDQPRSHGRTCAMML